MFLGPFPSRVELCLLVVCGMRALSTTTEEPQL